jgi:hypothetical protein
MVAEALVETDSLVAAVDALAAARIDTLSDKALGDDLMAIRRQIDRLEAEFLRRVHPFDRHHGALADGAVSTTSWLRSNCGVTASTAAQRVHMARVLAELPKTMSSLSEGRASFTNVSLIARLAEDVGTESTRSVEDALVTAAEQLDAGRMRYLTLVTRHRLDADGALAQDNRNHDRRWFACDQTYGGVFVLRGELDAEGGAILTTALDALTGPRARDDDRTGSQRRADALVDLASRQLRNGGLPSVHGQRPHLTVTASLETLQRRPGAGPADLGGAGPVHAETARRIACDSARSLVIVAESPAASDGDGSGRLTPLSVGRVIRSIPPSVRTALAKRDGTCRFPGCECPVELTEVHGCEHWADRAQAALGEGGDMDDIRVGDARLEDLLSLCRRHHRFPHEGGGQIRLNEHGEVEVIEPP